ncbi:hypothetical protein LFYK43_08870 [Ligilactobacillus salitolerans]|uniref:DUF1648 domain-containing protein n=1 Tax=Ligilactobacillus salitolerans TaxID=1808352 RepID=A0A401ISC2_9LACO|nr:SdpI family protein [Ligilactobacillus salitolerans]GBG94428.1 hypothetical protein LFYK43_08870 [Ligilactobacillus salitolerans]
MKNITNRNTMIWSSLSTLLPMLVGIFLWNKLPNNIATHFGTSGRADGWDGKGFTVFILPLIFLAIQLFVVFMVHFDPKNRNNSPWLLKIIYWLVPFITFISMLGIYGVAMGYSLLNSEVTTNALLGLVFVVIGILLLVVKQNYTIGIRISWTLNSKENWRRTNRLAGWLLILSGAVFLVNALLQVDWLIYAVIAIIVIIPIGYSFTLFQKGI